MITAQEAREKTRFIINNPILAMVQEEVEELEPKIKEAMRNGKTKIELDGVNTLWAKYYGYTLLANTKLEAENNWDYAKRVLNNLGYEVTFETHDRLARLNKTVVSWKGQSQAKDIQNLDPDKYGSI